MGKGDDNEEKYYSASSSAVYSGIYSHHGFSKASSLFIIAVFFVYIDGLSDDSESGKTCIWAHSSGTPLSTPLI